MWWMTINFWWRFDCGFEWVFVVDQFFLMFSVYCGVDLWLFIVNVFFNQVIYLVRVVESDRWIVDDLRCLDDLLFAYVHVLLVVGYWFHVDNLDGFFELMFLFFVGF